MFILISLVNNYQIFKRRNIYSTKTFWEKDAGEFSSGEFDVGEFSVVDSSDTTVIYCLSKGLKRSWLSWNNILMC